METWAVTMLKVILNVPFVKKTQVIFNWSTIRKLCIQDIESSFLEIILIVEWKKHLMEVLRMKL